MYKSKSISILLALLCLSSFAGCRAINNTVPLANPEGQPTVPNPLIVPGVDRFVIMDQISDELDDYFRIYREERIRIIDGILTEGWIETHPAIGSTMLEPWRKDSTPGFERIHATLQTVRRFAKVRVIPGSNNYIVDVKVYKELEDLQAPRNSTISGRTLRHDSSLDIDTGDSLLDPIIEPVNKGWIPMGRDFSLEQQILRNIQQRLEGVGLAGPPPLENCAVDPAAPPSPRIPRLFRHRRNGN